MSGTCEPMVTVLRSPRVFISHVNGDPSGEGIWPTLCDRLAAARFDVLVDRALLRAGDLWRAEIYGWIGLCDAAVILISRQALDDPSKHWVARETACLICRRYHEPSLKIIPVLLDGITFEDLEATERFRDLQLAESQCVRRRRMSRPLPQASKIFSQRQIPPLRSSPIRFAAYWRISTP